MTIFQFPCSYCGNMIEAKQAHRGEAAACPFCGQVVIVPQDPRESFLQKLTNPKNRKKYNLIFGITAVFQVVLCIFLLQLELSLVSARLMRQPGEFSLQRQPEPRSAVPPVSQQPEPEPQPPSPRKAAVPENKPEVPQPTPQPEPDSEVPLLDSFNNLPPKIQRRIRELHTQESMIEEAFQAAVNRAKQFPNAQDEFLGQWEKRLLFIKQRNRQIVTNCLKLKGRAVETDPRQFLRMSYSDLTREWPLPVPDGKYYTNYTADHIRYGLMRQNASIKLQELLNRYGLASVDLQSVKFLLFDGAEVTADMLTNAVGQKHTALTKMLLDSGFDPNSKDSRGETPLAVAAKSTSQIPGSLLTAAGASSHIAFPQEETSHIYDRHKKFINAWEKGNIDHCCTFFKANPFRVSRNNRTEITANYQLPNGLSLLADAALNGKTDILRRVLENGADPNFGGKFPETPLQYAVRRMKTDAFHMDKLQMVFLLISAGADCSRPPLSKSPAPGDSLLHEILETVPLNTREQVLLVNKIIEFSGKITLPQWDKIFSLLLAVNPHPVIAESILKRLSPQQLRQFGIKLIALPCRVDTAVLMTAAATAENLDQEIKCGHISATPLTWAVKHKYPAAVIRILRRRTNAP